MVSEVPSNSQVSNKEPENQLGGGEVEAGRSQLVQGQPAWSEK